MAADVNRLLIEFDTVIDTDIGIATLMNEEYNNPSFTNPRLFGLSQWEYKITFLNRHYENPLIMFLDHEHFNDAADLRKQMREDMLVYEKILRGSITTSIFDIIKEIGLMGRQAFEVTILCHNQQEIAYAKSVFPDFVRYVSADSWDFDGFDVSDYDTIFVKNIRTPEKFKNFMGKNLYVSRYMFNLDKNNPDAPDPELYTKYHLTAAIELTLIDAYGDANNAARDIINKVHKEDNANE